MPQEVSRTMKNHPIADVWPMMDEAKLQELADDIRKNGQLVPVWLYEGKILDGRNRWAACKIAGVEPKTHEYTGDTPTAFAQSLNEKRRHESASVRAAVAVELEPYFAEDAKRRQKQHGGTAPGKPKTLPENVPEVKKGDGDARKAAAVSVGVNDRYVSDAKKVKVEAPEVFERLKAGKITLQDAKREVAKKPTDDWRKDERDRQARVKDGITVVANASADKNLIAWAEGKGIAVRIDRGTRFGNPFILGEDGDRDEVCYLYEVQYLPHKRSIDERVDDLRGKVLVCHCFPERCHGDALASLANEATHA
jgi:hypothetical protein